MAQPIAHPSHPPVDSHPPLDGMLSKWGPSACVLFPFFLWWFWSPCRRVLWFGGLKICDLCQVFPHLKYSPPPPPPPSPSKIKREEEAPVCVGVGFGYPLGFCSLSRIWAIWPRMFLCDFGRPSAERALETEANWHPPHPLPF